MSIKQSNITIIEASSVVRHGLQLLLEKDARFVVHSLFSNVHDFHDNHFNNTSDIILINPTLVNFYKQFSIHNVFPDYENTIFVAIFYNYVDSETLDQFDGVLNIYDEEKLLVKKLHSIVDANREHKKTSHGDNADLSRREKEILASLAKGFTNKEIADKHFISTHTVVSHRKNIIRKTGIKTVSGLTIYALLNNLISKSDL